MGVSRQSLPRRPDLVDTPNYAGQNEDGSSLQRPVKAAPPAASAATRAPASPGSCRSRRMFAPLWRATVRRSRQARRTPGPLNRTGALYQYQCQSCGNRVEVFHEVAKRDIPAACAMPSCGGELINALSTRPSIPVAPASPSSWYWLRIASNLSQAASCQRRAPHGHELTTRCYRRVIQGLQLPGSADYRKSLRSDYFR